MLEDTEYAGGSQQVYLPEAAVSFKNTFGMCAEIHCMLISGTNYFLKCSICLFLFFLKKCYLKKCVF